MGDIDISDMRDGVCNGLCSGGDDESSNVSFLKGVDLVRRDTCERGCIMAKEVNCCYSSIV